MPRFQGTLIEDKNPRFSGTLVEEVTPTKKQPDPRMEDPRIIAGDLATTFATGAVAEPIAGLAGILASPFGEEGNAARTVEKVRNFMTVGPHTQGAQKIIGGIGELANAIGDIPISSSNTPHPSHLSFPGLAEKGIVTPQQPKRDGTIKDVIAAPADKTLEKAGPLAATVVHTLPAAIIELLTLKGVGKLTKQRAVESEISEQGIESILDESGEVMPEVQQALDANDIKLEDIARDDPEQLQRLGRFKELGAEPTKGELTRDTATLKFEQGLLESATDDSAKKLQSFKIKQSTQIREAIEQRIDALGLPGEAATTIKEALKSRKIELKKTRKAAYEALAEATKDNPVPIIPNALLKDMPDAGTQRTILAGNESADRQLKELLGEFGIKGDPPKDVELTPLTLANQEGFRTRLGIIEKGDKTGQMSVIIGPIRRALDEEVSLVAKVLEDSGNPNVSIMAKEARQSNIDLKTEFDEKAITEQLLSTKSRASKLALIEDSQVYNKLTSKAMPVEQVDRLVESLIAQGDDGVKALGNMQSAMLLDLLDSAFSAKTRKLEGIRLFGGNALQGRYEALKPKLNIIFKNNPRALAAIDRLSETAVDLTPPDVTKFKGSAGVLIDILQKPTISKLLKVMPGAAPVMEGVIALGRRAKNRELLEKTLNAEPDLKKSVKNIQRDYPSLAAVIGVSGIKIKESEDEEKTKKQNVVLPVVPNLGLKR